MAAGLVVAVGCTNLSPADEYADRAARPAGTTTVTAQPKATTATTRETQPTLPELWINLDHCPPDWIDEGGFDEERIVIATHGGTAGLDHAAGLAAYAHRVNAEGGVAGRQLKVITTWLSPGDAPQYLEGLTWALAQEPLAVSASYGSAVAAEMAERVDDACLPNLFWETTMPIPRLADRAWTVPGFRSTEAEVAIWLDWTVALYGPGATAGVMVMDDGWGDRWLATIKHRLESAEVPVELIVVRHDPGAFDLIDPVDELAEQAMLAGSELDVILSATVANPCQLLVDASRDHPDLTGVPVLVPSLCRQTLITQQPPATDIGTIMSVDLLGSDTLNDDDLDRLEELLGWRPDPALHPFTGLINGSLSHGWLAGALIVEAIETGAELPGGLSRSNVLRAARSQEVDHPLLAGAVLGDPTVRSGKMQQFDIKTWAWIDQSDLLMVELERRPEQSDPACEVETDRLTISTQGWTMTGGHLDPGATPSISLDGLAADLRHDEVDSVGWISAFAADGYTIEDFGRLHYLDHECSSRLTGVPESWFIEHLAAHPGPYELAVTFFPQGNYVTARATASATDPSPSFTLDQTWTGKPED